jgi:hypothetical protein
LECKRRVDHLNAQGISIAGEVASVDVIEDTGGPVRTIKRFELR